MQKGIGITNNNFVVYLLLCSDNSFYSGITNDIEKRLNSHNDGTGAKYTRSRKPVSLLRCIGDFTKSEALSLEYKIKSLSKMNKLGFIDSLLENGCVNRML